MSTFVHDTTTVFVRQVLPSLRSPSSLVFGMLQPLVFLALFGPLLEGFGDGLGPAGTGSASTWQWFVPGVLVMLALFGTTGTGYMLLTEIETGSQERLLVTPLGRPAMLLGRTLNDVATLVAQAVLIVAVMVPFGFRLHLGALVGLGLLVLLGVGVGGLSHALAIACRRSQEAFYMIQSSVQFPLLFLSGLMLPLDSAPTWMRVLGRANPLTYVVDAMRAVFDGRVLEAAVLHGTVVALAVAAVGLALGTRAMARTAG